MTGVLDLCPFAAFLVSGVKLDNFGLWEKLSLNIASLMQPRFPSYKQSTQPAIYMFKFNNKDTGTTALSHLDL